MSAARNQISSADMADPEKFRQRLNEIFMAQDVRLQKTESAPGLVELFVGFETEKTLGPSLPPFVNGGVRVSCPFTPTGLTLLRIDRTMPSGQPVSSVANEVKWRFAAGPRAATGALIIDFVTGLELDSRYELRVGVTRG